MAGRRARREALQTQDGVTLDARIEGPADAGCIVVWCHPHPLMGGTMFAPLMNAVADGLVEADLGVLRFDFRGVGASSGSHDGGTAEVADVAAAMSRASELAPRTVLAGWSFGAFVSLRYVAAAHRVPYVGVAPPIEDPSEFTGIAGGDMSFVLGTRDFAIDNSKVEHVAGAIGASVTRVPTDHLFVGHAHVVVEAIVRASAIH